jgi:hypothetical protein
VDVGDDRAVAALAGRLLRGSPMPAIVGDDIRL